VIRGITIKSLGPLNSVPRFFAVIFLDVRQMRFYLSSYRIGDHGNRLCDMVGDGKLACISNALDAWPREDTRQTRERNVLDLKAIGVSCEEVDLQDFFDRPAELKEKLSDFSGVWVSGGNTFVLRQAMRLSEFDNVISDLQSPSFLFGGYSAGVCVLAPHLRALQIVDEPDKFPYPQQKEVIWEGLGLLDHIILPHYKSDHPESADIDKEVEFCKANDIPYKTLRDGEVLFGDDIRTLRRGIELNP